MDRNYDATTFILKYLSFQKVWSSFFADIIKIINIFIRTIFKDSNKIKIIENYARKCNIYLYFLMKQNLLISGEKYWCEQNSSGASRDLYIFWIFFR